MSEQTKAERLADELGDPTYYEPRIAKTPLPTGWRTEVTTQPTALRLFTHQLLDCDGKPNGVHVGCDDLAICKKSYIEGETSPAIHEWVDAAELRRLHAVNAELLEALHNISLASQDSGSTRGGMGRDARAAIAKAEGA
jgi:hypothetical protein